MNSFGKQLQHLREGRDLSQKELGEALGVHQTTISGIERDERLPSAELVMAISRFFDLPLEKLLDADAWATSRSISRNARAAELAQ